ncbi:hypothetical protein G7K_4892-t1 [Saitoella complicata NRRL Y-17804]|uniref:Uncharacterized protein n=1 Tax=Saitoella complicata (strain BCRC 22490 / CBS 7301 / JCM 7358 / NBRC 10748 / NRRL Y-17804) TaxID=698492 RepID=A0A0E9NM43_SAICN|nr:hypothetical protein G7K_4892-t1 [Saitoella complicata NRRL Y-17804]
MGFTVNQDSYACQARQDYACQRSLVDGDLGLKRLPLGGRHTMCSSLCVSCYVSTMSVVETWRRASLPPLSLRSHGQESIWFTLKVGPHAACSAFWLSISVPQLLSQSEISIRTPLLAAQLPTSSPHHPQYLFTETPLVHTNLYHTSIIMKFSFVLAAAALTGSVLVASSPVPVTADLGIHADTQHSEQGQYGQSQYDQGNGKQQPKQQPNDGKQQPSNGKQQPNDGKQQPNDGKQQPNNGKQQPNNGKQQPNNGKQQPNDGKQQPNDGKQQPNDGKQSSGGKPQYGDKKGH